MFGLLQSIKAGNVLAGGCDLSLRKIHPPANGTMIMFEALRVISDGKEVVVAPVPNYNRKPALSWDAYLEVPDPDTLAAEFASRGVRFSVALGEDMI